MTKGFQTFRLKGGLRPERGGGVKGVVWACWFPMMATMEAADVVLSRAPSLRMRRAASRGGAASDDGAAAGDTVYGGEEDSALLLPPSSSSAPAAPSPAAKSTPSPWRLAAAAAAGNVLEWYDFGLFASFSDELSEAFFPAGGGTLMKEVKIYGVFAVAFVARPVGGFLSGLVGDACGRTRALQISVVAMGASALAVAALPTHSLGSYAIGPAASYLLVACRAVQGLSAGGEIIGSMLVCVEGKRSPAERNGAVRGAIAAIPIASGVLGIALSYVVAAYIAAATSKAQRALWGWRIGFALGVPTAAIGLFLRAADLTAGGDVGEGEDGEEGERGGEEQGVGAGMPHPFARAARGAPGALALSLACAFAFTCYLGSSGWYAGVFLEVGPLNAPPGVCARARVRSNTCGRARLILFCVVLLLLRPCVHACVRACVRNPSPLGAKGLWRARAAVLSPKRGREREREREREKPPPIPRSCY